MIKQWGKNPEYTFSICSNHNWWGGELALPIKLSWWNYNILGSKCNEISITILCFCFSLEIWRWKNEIRNL